MTEANDSQAGDNILRVALVFSVLAMLGSIIWAIVSLFHSDFLTALVLAPFSFVYNCAMAVVFHRVRSLGDVLQSRPKPSDPVPNE